MNISSNASSRPARTAGRPVPVAATNAPLSTRG